MNNKKTENKNFLQRQIENDLKNKKYTSIVTRFPPEPNGYPHIGHAKSIFVNFGLAKEFGGVCNIRMDDTDPTKEETKYVKALKDAVKWLGFSWEGEVRYTSDYFPKLYEYAIRLIKMEKAYVDSLDEEEIKIYRGSVTQPGKRSEFAKRSIEENLDLFERMRKGEFKDGEHILRAKIDMSNANMKMRDPLLYRIKHAYHFRTKDEWCIYPMYDFAHCLSDYIEGITHSICTLEFENNREIYDWVLESLELEKPRPYQHEFARLDINYTLMSKRKLLELVQEKKVDGWDDPRLPTIEGYKRRGYTKEAILNFCESIGVAKANSQVDVAQLEFCIRDDLNQKVKRVMCVLDPLKVELENYSGCEEIDASFYPEDVKKQGSRKLSFSNEIYIERDDFCENPPKGYFRLTPNQPVRLKHGYIITCKEVVKDENGQILKIIAKVIPNSKSGFDKSGVKTKSAIQWVDKNTAKSAEIRLYDRLFINESPESFEDLNPNSLKIIKNALVEKAAIEESDERFQFERQGYFYKDPALFSKENPVFNKIVGLKDGWNKQQKSTIKPKQKASHTEGEVAPLSQKEQKIYEKLIKTDNLNQEIANTLAKDEFLYKFYEDALKEFDGAKLIANLVTNEVARELKINSDLKFSPKNIATLAKMLFDENISSKIAKDIFEIMSKTGQNPEEIIKEKGLIQINDKAQISTFIDEVIAKNETKVNEYKAGNSKLFGFFVGEVLKLSKGRANPKVVNELVGVRLASLS